MATNTHLLDEQDDALHQPQAPTQPAQEQTAQEHHEPANLAVALLKGMFPDFDDAVLQSVLESVNWNQDAAIDVLLGMSDPSYVSTHQPTVHTEAANPSLDLDEALARQLQLEDERVHQQARGTNWQPRQSRRNSNPAAEGQGQQPEGPQGDQIQEIKETFNQLAESGKRTFSSIVSRVKAKINEYDQNKPGNSSQSQHPPPSWGYSSTSQQPPSAQGSPNPASYPSYYAEVPSQPADRHATSQAYAQYYNHEADEDSEGWTAVTGRGRPTQTKAVTEQPKPIEVKGYDVDPPSPQPAPAAAASSPAAAPVPAYAASEPQEPSVPAASSPGSDVPRPPVTQSGSPLNAAKFGLLPKRPVSLLTPQASAARQHPEDDDDDELEYAENPFEDSRH